MPDPCPLPVDLLDRRYRAGRAYRLVPLGRLTATQREGLSGLEQSEHHFALLVPRAQEGRGVKVIDRDGATLFRRLARPGTLPSSFGGGGPEEARRAVARLLLDGALEVADGRRFVGGAAAHPLLFPDPPAIKTAGRVPALSRAALQYGALLPILEPERLSARLYLYNTLPAGGAPWQSCLAHPAAIESALGLEPDGRATRRLAQDYLDGDHPAWRMYHALDRVASAEPPPLPYKLYISPHPAALPALFLPLVSRLADLAVPAFKLGRDLPGLLRPDKMVIYLETLERVRQVAGALRPLMAGTGVQGVPFTCPLGDDGLLSWGMDPPEEERLLDWQTRESWRLWLTNRLARALIDARISGCGRVEPWRYALDRLRLEGVAPDTWIPDRPLWAAEVQAA